MCILLTQRGETIGAEGRSPLEKIFFFLEKEGQAVDKVDIEERSFKKKTLPEAQQTQGIESMT